MPRSAPMARAVRMVSCTCGRPSEMAITSVALPASLRRTASSTPISSNGFIDILTFAVSTPVPSALTPILTLKSTTRLTATRTFMGFDPTCCSISMMACQGPHPRLQGHAKPPCDPDFLRAHNRSPSSDCQRAGGSAIGARAPQDVLASLVVQVSGKDEEVVRQPVDILDRCRVHGTLFGERGHGAFGPARDRAGKVERRRRRLAAGQHERLQRLQRGIHGVDLALQPIDLG